MTEKLRYGILGTGMMGQEHLRNLRLIPEIEVVAFADTNEQMARKASRLVPSATRVSDLDALLKEGLDALVIATPNYQHADQLLALSREPQLSVLVEKPICTDMDQLARLEEAMQGRAAPLWVGMEYRFMPAMQAFLGNAPRVGKKHILSIREHRYPFLKKVDDWNRFNRFSGGTFVEKCCHFFDLMRLILGQDPVRVYATGGQGSNHLDETYAAGKPDIFDHGLVVIDFAEGAKASLDLCMFAEGARFEQDVSLTGSEARLDVHIPGPHPKQSTALAELNVFPRAGDAETLTIDVPKEIQDAGAHQGATYYAHQAFLTAIKEGKPPAVDLRDGLMAVLMGMAAQASIASGEAIAVDAGALSLGR